MRLRSRDLKAQSLTEDPKCVACNGTSNYDDVKRTAKKRSGGGGLVRWTWIDCSDESSSLIKFVTGVSLSALSIFTKIWQIDSPRKAVYDIDRLMQCNRVLLPSIFCSF